MPRTHGDAFAPVEAIDFFVRSDAPLPELAPAPPDAASAAIGRHVAALIPDGACLQMGIGKIPNAVAQGERAPAGRPACRSAWGSRGRMLG